MTVTAVCKDEEASELLALPLLYTLACFSFDEARPCGSSEQAYCAKDALSSLLEFLQTLTYEQGCLHWYGDYMKGRRVKTALRLNPQGHFTLRTVGRGLGPDFWLRYLAGEKPLQVIPAAQRPPKQSRR